jgi:hypothetical protein
MMFWSCDHCPLRFVTCDEALDHEEICEFGAIYRQQQELARQQQQQREDESRRAKEDENVWKCDYCTEVFESCSAVCDHEESCLLAADGGDVDNQEEDDGHSDADTSDGRKPNGNSWTWIQQDYNVLERIVAAAEYPIDWGAIGSQMNPIRSAVACQNKVKLMKNYGWVEVPSPPAKKLRVE